MTTSRAREDGRSADPGGDAPARAGPGRRSQAPVDTRVVLVAILVAAALVRLAGAWAGSPCVITDDAEEATAARAAGRCVSYNDAATYLSDARFNVDGQWFKTQETGQPPRDTALHAPLFTLVLTPFVAAGLDTFDSLRPVVALAGTGAVAVVFLVGRTLAGRRAGLIAAAIAAVHPLIWINDVVLMPEGLFAAAVGGVALLAYRFHEQPTTARAVALGAGIAAAGLLRNEAMLAFAFIAVPVVLGHRRLPPSRRTIRLLAAVGAAAVVVAPWVGFNWARFDRPTLTNGAGAGLRIGTCDEAFYNDDLLGLRSVDCIGASATELEGGETEADRSQALQEGALEYYGQNLGRAPVVVVARVARFWAFWRPFESVRLDDAVEQRGAQRAQIGVVVGWLLIPPAVVGGVVLWRRRTPLSPLVGWIAASTTLAAINLPLQRFRIGGDVAMVVLAAVGLVAMARQPWVRTLVGQTPVPPAGPIAPARPQPGRPPGEDESPPFAQRPMARPPSTGTTAPVT